jgi:hypothetical protein
MSITIAIAVPTLMTTIFGANNASIIGNARKHT